jgi:lysophospholipase L1-like esterase
MRTPLRKKLLFFSILALILVLMNSWLDRELNPHYPLQYREVFHPKVNADMIILGSSDATHGINPRYLEKGHLRVFNFSLNGAGPSFYLMWYRKIFQPNYPRPLYVIYGVHWSMFDENLLKRALEQDSKYFPNQFLFHRISDFAELRTLVMNRVAFIRERKQLTDRLFRRHREVYLLSKYYNGFIPYERRGGLDRKRNVKPKNSQARIGAFEELLDEFEKNGIRTILVQIPGYLPARHDENIRESMEILNRVAKERKIPFLDYDTKKITNINTDRSMFADWIHLNEKGSDAFSQLLRNDLDFLLKRKTAYGRGASI